MRTILMFAAFSLATTALVTDLAQAASRKFSAGLVRDKEVIAEHAQGRATFRLSEDGRELHFKVTVENLKSFTQAHIHMAPDALRDESMTSRFHEPPRKYQHGPIVLFLTQFKRHGKPVDGVLAEGVATSSNLVGPLKGAPLSLLTELMARSKAYVAVHVIKQIDLGNEFCCPVGLQGQIQIGGTP
jgi:hypothetical protein